MRRLRLDKMEPMYILVLGMVMVSSLSSVQAADIKNPLKIIAIEEPPYIMKDKTTGKYSGLLIDILNEAGVKTDQMELQDAGGEFGWEERPDVFEEVIDKVSKKTYDLAVAPFSIRSKGSKMVTYTQPIIHAGYMVLFKTPKDWSPVYNELGTLVKPFSPLVWGLLVVMCFGASIVLFVIRRFSPYEDATVAPPTTKGDYATGRFSFGSGFLYLFGSMLGQSYNVAPRSISGRILTSVWWLFSLMTVAAYVSSLVVILFRTNPHMRTLPFASVNEMLKQTDVKVLGVKGSATYNYISNHTGFWEKKVHQMWKHRWDELMVDSVSEALKMLDEGNGKYAVFMDEASADYIASSAPCDKMVVGEPVGDKRIGLVCPKESQVCEQLNHVILNLQEQGRMEELREKWFWSGCHMSSELFYEGHPYLDSFNGFDKDVFEPTTVSMLRFGAGFILIVVGMLLALVVLIIEMVYARRTGNFHHLLTGGGKNGDLNNITHSIGESERDL